MTKCDPFTRAQCPHAAYCEPFAVYTDESECAKFAKRVLNKTVTNADRIRAMSDEELAKWMAECNAYGENADASQWLPWLRQPAEVLDG